MKIKIQKYKIGLIVVGFTLFLCCNQKTSDHNVLELSLMRQTGFGNFSPALGAVSTVPEAIDSAYLNVKGAPKDWIDITYGCIETNVYQAVYQNYIHGKISKKSFKDLQEGWDWNPDTLHLSRKALKTKIALAHGRDAQGVLKIVVDANNNLDFSDDSVFIPFSISIGSNVNLDSASLRNTIIVSYERLSGNEKQLVTTSVFMAYVDQAKMLMYSFPQFCITDLEGQRIAVGCFTDLSYENPVIILLTDSMGSRSKVSADNLVSKNEYIEVKGVVYKVMGVNTNNDRLVLEKMNLPKNGLMSTQIGYKAFPLNGRNFITGKEISSDQLKGKYVLLDFWATWCKPCREEIPYLKKLHEKTSREKFEIIGVVGESSSESLKELITKDKLMWPQILSNDSNRIKETFGVIGYPTNFLINPDGIIVAKNLRGQDLANRVYGYLK